MDGPSRPSRRAASSSTILSLPSAILERLMEEVMKEEGGFRKIALVCRSLSATLGPHLGYTVTFPGGFQASEFELQRDLQRLGRVTSLTLEKGSVKSLSFRNTGRSLRSARAAEGSSTLASGACMPAREGMKMLPTQDSTVAGPLEQPTEAPQQPWTQHLKTLSLDCVPIEFENPSDAAAAFPLLTHLSIHFIHKTGQSFAWLEHLPKLEHLYVQDWRGDRCERNVQLSFPPTLHFLRLNGLNNEFLLESIGDLKQLKELHLRQLTLREVPDSLGSLSSLQRLSICRCSYLQSLPASITQLENLRELQVSCIDNIFSEMTIPDLGANIQASLRVLRLTCGDSRYWLSQRADVRCSSDMVLPLDLRRCSALQTLSLLGLSLSSLKRLTWLEDLRSLRSLKMVGCQVLSLPDVFGRLPNLEELLIRSQSLRSIPNSLVTGAGANRSLKRLGIFGDFLQDLPSGFGSKSKLKELKELSLMGGLKEGRGWSTPIRRNLVSKSWASLEVLRIAMVGKVIPAAAAKNLPLLRELHVICKAQVQPWKQVQSSLEGFISHLPQLQELNLSCDDSRLYPTVLRTLGNLTSLELGHRSLGSQRSLESGHKSQGKLNRVVWATPLHTFMGIWYHSTTQEILRPHSSSGAGLHPGLTALQSLGLNCWGMGNLPAPLLSLSSLARLSLNPCTGAQSLPQSFAALSNIQDLRFGNTDHLEQLPPGLSSLVKLRKLTIWKCGWLQSFALLPEWAQLENLSITDCPLLEMTPDSLSVCPSITYLTLSCNTLRQVVAGLSSLHNLNLLCLPNCSEGDLACHHRTPLPLSICRLPRLTTLRLYAKCLAEVPVALSEVRHLETLSLKRCGWSGPSKHLLCVPLPETLPGLPFEYQRRLQGVVQHLAGLTNLETEWLPRSLHCLTNLQSLHLKRYKETCLSPAVGVLMKLTSLTCEDSEYLESFPPEIEALPRLVSLTLRGCPRLRVVTHEAQGYPFLRDVTVVACPLIRADLYTVSASGSTSQAPHMHEQGRTDVAMGEAQGVQGRKWEPIEWEARDFARNR